MEVPESESKIVGLHSIGFTLEIMFNDISLKPWFSFDKEMIGFEWLFLSFTIIIRYEWEDVE